MKQVYVITADATERIIHTLQRLCVVLEEEQTAVIMDKKWKDQYGSLGVQNIRYIESPATEIMKACTCILSIGGDGTLLRAAAAASDYNLPLAGVNVGKVGFLAKIPETVPREVIGRILRGELKENRYMTLEACREHGMIPTALNDITLSNMDPGHMCTFQIYCDEEQVALWRADGVIIYTPTGSTAYAYSAGGPAIEPGLQMIGIMPICLQNGRRNGLICSSNRKIKIVSTGAEIRVSSDGRTAGYLKQGEELSVFRGNKEIRFLQIDNLWKIRELNRVLNNLENHLEE